MSPSRGQKCGEELGKCGVFGEKTYVLTMFSCLCLNITPGPPLSWPGYCARWKNQTNQSTHLCFHMVSSFAITEHLRIFNIFVPVLKEGAIKLISQRMETHEEAKDYLKVTPKVYYRSGSTPQSSNLQLSAASPSTRAALPLLYQTRYICSRR